MEVWIFQACVIAVMREQRYSKPNSGSSNPKVTSFQTAPDSLTVSDPAYEVRSQHVTCCASSSDEANLQRLYRAVQCSFRLFAFDLSPSSLSSLFQDKVQKTVRIIVGGP